MIIINSCYTDKGVQNVASDISFIEFIADQTTDAGTITYRKMFGEYAVYCNGKIVALVCDNQLFVKSSDVVKMQSITDTIPVVSM
jgi:TfoX/Sxy family transcriptional regulator of competence genes